jgi:chemotaxis protein MotB
MATVSAEGVAAKVAATLAAAEIAAVRAQADLDVAAAIAESKAATARAAEASAQLSRLQSALRMAQETAATTASAVATEARLKAQVAAESVRFEGLLAEVEALKMELGAQATEASARTGFARTATQALEMATQALEEASVAETSPEREKCWHGSLAVAVSSGNSSGVQAPHSVAGERCRRWLALGRAAYLALEQRLVAKAVDSREDLALKASLQELAAALIAAQERKRNIQEFLAATDRGSSDSEEALMRELEAAQAVAATAIAETSRTREKLQAAQAAVADKKRRLVLEELRVEDGASAAARAVASAIAAKAAADAALMHARAEQELAVAEAETRAAAARAAEAAAHVLTAQREVRAAHAAAVPKDTRSYELEAQLSAAAQDVFKLQADLNYAREKSSSVSTIKEFNLVPFFADGSRHIIAIVLTQAALAGGSFRRWTLLLLGEISKPTSKRGMVAVWTRRTTVLVVISSIVILSLFEVTLVF